MSNLARIHPVVWAPHLNKQTDRKSNSVCLLRQCVFCTISANNVSLCCSLFWITFGIFLPCIFAYPLLLKSQSIKKAQHCFHLGGWPRWVVLMCERLFSNLHCNMNYVRTGFNDVPWNNADMNRFAPNLKKLAERSTILVGSSLHWKMNKTQTPYDDPSLALCCVCIAGTVLRREDLCY